MKSGQKILLGMVVVAVVIAGLALLVRRGSRSETASMPTFVLSVNTWVGFGPFWLAQEKGFFADEGVNVEIQTIEDVAQKKAAMLAGRIDGVGDTIDSFVLAKDEGVPVTLVAELDGSNGADGILTLNDVQRVSDLKGKTIAAQKNFVSEAFLNYLLVEHGLSPNDVHVVDTEAGAAGAAFASGSVDAAVTFEPWLSKASSRAGGKVLVSSREYPDILVDGLLVRNGYLKDHPDTVKRVMRAWFRAIEYWKAHPDEANAIMAGHYQETPEVFAELIEGVTWPTYEESTAYVSSDRALNVVDTFGDVFLRTGQITQKADLRSAISADVLSGLYARP